MNKKQAYDELSSVDGFFRHWMPRSQRAALREALKGEEGNHFAEMLTALKAHIEAMPISYQTDGRLVFHVFAALAEFERRLIVERTMAGLAAARARGRKGGRPGLPAEKVAAIQALAASGRGPAEVCKALGIGRSTFYKHTRGIEGNAAAGDKTA